MHFKKLKTRSGIILFLEIGVRFYSETTLSISDKFCTLLCRNQIKKTFFSFYCKNIFGYNRCQFTIYDNSVQIHRKHIDHGEIPIHWKRPTLLLNFFLSTNSLCYVYWSYANKRLIDSLFFVCDRTGECFSFFSPNKTKRNMKKTTSSLCV